MQVQHLLIRKKSLYFILTLFFPHPPSFLFRRHFLVSSFILPSVFFLLSFSSSFLLISFFSFLPRLRYKWPFFRFSPNATPTLSLRTHPRTHPTYSPSHFIPARKNYITHVRFPKTPPLAMTHYHPPKKEKNISTLFRKL